MARRRLLVSVAAAILAGAFAVAGAPTGAAVKPKPPTRPDKVVIIVVDALSKEIVEKYDMANVKALMADGVDTPRGYLGHTGSVTVVTHNVITSGMLPKNMGWTNEGFRDVDGVLGAPGGLYITSNFGYAQMSALQEHAGYPHLSDYLDDSGKVFTVSPKGYAAYGLSGPGSANTSVTTFASGPSCNGVRWRMPDGIAVPPYIAGTCGSRYWVERDKGYDTLQFPAQLYPATDDRYVVGDEPGNQGGDVWATDAALDIMDHEEEAWSGIFVSLPGIDKAAHMWGGVNDPEGATPGYDPMTHMEYAAATADAQVGRIMDELDESGELESTLVVLTADHGSVAAADGHWHGDFEPENDYGYYNWYYGDPENDVFYDQPQEALQPLIDTGNVGLSYSDSSLNVWLKDQSAASVAEAAAIM
ncbi:MAG TPA: alkaline phosphatase family protein, partial [Dermatophilaceae bacterium]|nr:alkaline phosphatase family protein [Dermatophilaceae bacterium]